MDEKELVVRGDERGEHIDQARWMQGGLASRGVTQDRDGYNTYEPPPTGKGTVILPLVQADLQDRAAHGHAKYGTYLRADNGRDALVDAYQEALDLVMYLRQVLEERDQDRLDAQSETKARIDEFLKDPSTGVVRVRPAARRVESTPVASPGRTKL